MKTVHIGNGLLDGLRTASTGVLIRELAKLGASVKLASTGRARVTDAAGNVTVYTVNPPKNRRESDAFEAAGTTSSPLTRALADLEETK